MQRYLLGVVGKEPMTFKQILDIAVPAGTFEGDMARALGTSSVSVTRSLRRALFKLCRLDVLQKLDIKTPHSYRLHPDFQCYEYNPEMIGLGYRCRKDWSDNPISAEQIESAIKDLDERRTSSG